jgi:hypothetical protein
MALLATSEESNIVGVAKYLPTIGDRGTAAVARIAALVALGGAVGLGAGACSRLRPAEQSRTEAEPGPPAPVVSGPPLVHPTGLVLGPQPPARRVRETQTGFHIEPADARRLRNPWSVELRLSDSDPLNGSDLETRKLGERAARYRVSTDDKDTGSGGPMHTLVAWIPCGAFRIVMTATQQAEPPAQPDWSPAWAILGAGRCEPRR